MKFNCLILIMLIPIITPFPLNAETDSPWSGEGELGFLMISGNSDTESANGQFTIKYESASWRHNASFSALYSAEEIETESGESEMETASQEYLVSAKTDYKFTENNYAFLTGSYEDDRFSGYDYQTSFAAGYGRRLFKTNRMLMEIEVGPGWRYNRLNDGGEEKEAIIRGYALFSTKLTEGATFRQELSVESGSDQTVTKSISSVKAQVIGNFSMKAAYTAEYTSSVPEDTDKTETKTALTLVYGF